MFRTIMYRRAFVLPFAVVIGVAAGCSASQGPADPLTVAQASARLLARDKAPGFVPEGMFRIPGEHLAGKAQPFVPPQGSPAQICTSFITPVIFAPAASISSNEMIGVASPRRYRPSTPSWNEWVDVYPGAEATDIVKALPALIRNCGQFDFQSPRGFPAQKGPRLPFHEAATPLPGLGDQALYVSVRPTAEPAGYVNNQDWIVIRSDRTLIWIIGQYLRPAGTAHDRLTMQLTQEAWRHYSGM